MGYLPRMIYDEHEPSDIGFAGLQRIFIHPKLERPVIPIQGPFAYNLVYLMGWASMATSESALTEEINVLGKFFWKCIRGQARESALKRLDQSGRRNVSRGTVENCSAGNELQFRAIGEFRPKFSKIPGCRFKPAVYRFGPS